MDRLTSYAIEVEAAPDGYFDIAKAAKRCNLSAGEIIQAILDHKITRVVSVRTIKGYDAIYVDPTEVK
ncbi:hypothetical protein ABTD90_21045, partial [Acinetobacter baumannii]